jgi:predicted transcriptional regulator
MMLEEMQDAKAPDPGMTWAEMAAKEGHKPGLPPSPVDKTRSPEQMQNDRDAIMACLREQAKQKRKKLGLPRLASKCRLPEVVAGNTLQDLIEDGLVVCVESGKQKTYQSVED